MTTILIKKKDTAGAPAPGDLTNAAGGTEIAVNTATKRIYTKDSGGNVVELGTNSTSSTIDQLTVVTSTTLSYGTANQVQYLNASKLLVGSSNLTFNGTTLTANTIGAFTLSGTIAGGGNQINNVIIGTSTPLAGSFTTLTASTSITNSSLTSGRVTYATTAGLLTDSANLLYSGTDLTVYGITVGRGAGAVSTNTAVGASALAANTTGQYNTVFGNGTGNAITTSQQNSFFGYQAGFKTTGGDNTGIGSVALYNNTSGGQNTAIGRSALESNTTASNNTAVGYQAGYLNVTGTNITLIGYQAGTASLANNVTAVGARALFTNTSGSSLVAVGGDALRSNISGSDTTAVGQGALYTSSTGSFNTAIGAASLLNSTTSSNNTAVGTQALLNYTNGAGGTVAVGHQAGYSTNAGYGVYVGQTAGYFSTGTQATHVGFQAGFYTTTGTGNTSLGWSALQGSSGATGQYNTALGAQALFSNTTASNNTAVGYQAGYSNTTGSVTAFGESALRLNTTGVGNIAFGSNAGYSMTTNNYSTYIGHYAGYFATGGGNVFVGNSGSNGSAGAGYYMTTGINNVLIGGYTGDQDLLDIRTANNYVVLSTGLGQRQLSMYEGGTVALDNAVPVAGTGITFPATQSASSNANTLDDYEEGTWTPAFTSTGASFTYPRGQMGRYVKVGTLVSAQFYLGADATGTLSNGIQISGLPFVSNATELVQGTVSAWISQPTNLGFTVNSGFSTVTIWPQNSGAGTTALTSQVAGGYVVGVITYTASN